MTNKENKLLRPKKTTEELRAASDAFHYEIRMLNDVADVLSSHTSGVIHDALVESFVVHTRILIEFFYPTDKTRADSDTMIASDFLSDGNQWKEDISEWMKEIRTRSHKLLAHLSYNRVLRYKDDKSWQITQIRNRMNVIFDDWLKKVPSGRIGEKLKTYKELLEKLTAIGGVGVNCNSGVIANGNSIATASTGTAYTAGVVVTKKLIK